MHYYFSSYNDAVLTAMLKVVSMSNGTMSTGERTRELVQSSQEALSDINSRYYVCIRTEVFGSIVYTVKLYPTHTDNC
jgi:hypothetical protein